MPHDRTTQPEPSDCDECHGSVKAGHYCPNCGINRCNEEQA